ncbi:winged helix-turn-helix domain-containing protein [Actinocatenispora sera]|uniref:winged helix-turn-helix domain-containing protein n=1 Tax=Actinocatenispora sera TaxID=390989 RepID=UPI003CC7DA9B
MANALRAAILTGRFPPGNKLPSQNDLAARYNVARETVKRALAQLHAEHLTVSRQGSGVFVRQRTERQSDSGPTSKPRSTGRTCRSTSPDSPARRWPVRSPNRWTRSAPDASPRSPSRSDCY